MEQQKQLWTVDNLIEHLQGLSISSKDWARIAKVIQKDLIIKAEAEERKQALAKPFVPDDSTIECFADTNLNLSVVWNRPGFEAQPQDRFSKVVAAHFLYRMLKCIDNPPEDARLWMDTKLHHGTQTDMGALTDDFVLMWNSRIFLIDAKTATTLRVGNTHSYMFKKKSTGTIDGYFIILPRPEDEFKGCSRVADTAGAPTFKDAMDLVHCVVFIAMDLNNKRLCGENVTVNMEKTFVKDVEKPTKDGIECLYKWAPDKPAGICSPYLKTWLSNAGKKTQPPS